MNRTCPSEEQLRAFHLGTLPDSEVDALTEHLERCPACETALQRLDAAPDPLLSALRKPVSSNSSLFRLHPSKNASGPDLMAPENWPKLPDYEILTAIGRGGMGVVYKARHLRLNRLVALKRFRISQDRNPGRSRIEAEALSRLQHPNIVQIHEIIEHNGETFLVLELVNGGSLGAKLRGKPQPPRETAFLLEAIARAIHYAHGYGIIHRDLKPANILLKDERKKMKEENDADPVTASAVSFVLQPFSFIPKITDFGVAKRLAVDSGETREGDVIGTPAYMAPEQATGKTELIGPATDVYSLGVILYELLTGRVPLQGPTTLETLILVRSEDPVPPRRLVPRIPRDLETICLKCLEKEPGNRYRHAEELANDLRRYQNGEPILARPTPTWERAWKWVKRRPVIAALSAALVFVTFLGFGLVAWQWQRAEAKANDEAVARKEAQDNEKRAIEARRQIEKIAAGMTLSHGVALCEKGHVDHGLLWLVRALERAERAEDVDLQRVARSNLASWQPFLVRSPGEVVHGSWVYCVAFSPDGRSAVSASIDKTAQRLDPATAKPVGEPLRHPLPVSIAVYSPDSKKILTACGEFDGDSGQARIWDAVTGKELVVSPRLEGDIALATFSPDGKTFLLVCSKEIRVWRTEDGAPVGQPFQHPAAAAPNPKIQPKMVAVLRPDGTLLATAGEDHTIRLWDPATGKQKGEPLQADGPVTAIAFSPDGATIVTGTFLGAVQMWNAETGEQHGPTLHNSGQVRAIAFGPDGECLATGSSIQEVDPVTQARRFSGGEVRLWRAASGQQLGSPLLHGHSVWSLAFGPTGRILLTGCEDGMARFFAVATGQQIGIPLRHPGTVVSVAFSPNGKTALTASAGGGEYHVARFWDVPSQQAFGQQLLQGGQIGSLEVSADNRFLLTGADDKKVRFWDLESGRLADTLVLADREKSLATFSPDGRTVMTTSAALPYYDKSRLRFWDSTTHRLLTTLDFPSCLNAIFSPDGRTILVSELDQPLKVFSLDGAKNPEEGMPRPSQVFWEMSFSPDGRKLLTKDTNGFQLWDAGTFQRLQNWKEPTGTTCLFYPDGKRILLVTGGFPHCWDAATGTELELPRFHAEGGLSKGVFSPDGRRILTAGSDGVARLWDVATGQTLGPPLGRDSTSQVAFSHDGRKLITAGRHGRITVWNEPAPLEGDSERLRLWIEVHTGLELEHDEAIQELGVDALKQRRRRLDEVGGPPTLPWNENESHQR